MYEGEINGEERDDWEPRGGTRQSSARSPMAGRRGRGNVPGAMEPVVLTNWLCSSDSDCEGEWWVSDMEAQEEEEGAKGKLGGKEDERKQNK